MLERLLKIFFHLLYHPLAWSYDTVAAVVSLGRWKQWVYTILPFIAGPEVLELGFGPGHLLAELSRQGFQVTGLDASRQMVYMAARRLRAGQADRLPNLILGRGETLPFACQAFQTVAATFPAPYITSPQALDEIYRVLAPGGRIVIVLAAWITGHSLPDRAADLLFRLTGETLSLDDDRLVRLQTRFEQAGFIAEMSWLPLPTSRLLLIQARKATKEMK